MTGVVTGIRERESEGEKIIFLHELEIIFRLSTHRTSQLIKQANRRAPSQTPKSHPKSIVAEFRVSKPTKLRKRK